MPFSGSRTLRGIVLLTTLIIALSAMTSHSSATALAVVEESPSGVASSAIVGRISGLGDLPTGELRLSLTHLDGTPVSDATHEVPLDRAGGSFRLSGVVSGSYLLRLNSPGGVQFLSTGLQYSFAVRGNSETSLQLTARNPSAAVSGTAELRTPFSPGELADWEPYSSVGIYRLVEDRWAEVTRVPVAAPKHAYISALLVPGSYTVQFTGFRPCVGPERVGDEHGWECSRALIPQWWPGRSSSASATRIELGAGQHRGGIEGVATEKHRDVLTASPGSERAPHQFWGDVVWMYDRGLSTGVNRGADNYYLPQQAVTREAMAAFMYRYAGAPEFTPPTKPSFADVPRNHKFSREIEWMKKQGLTTGIREGGKLAYRPKSSVSREAMAAFLYRYAGKPVFDATQAKTFRDVPHGHKFAREIHWMSSTGITTGVRASGGLVYQPLTSVKRDAMAAFLHRYDRSR